MECVIRAKIDNKIYIANLASDHRDSYKNTTADYIGVGTYYSYDGVKADDTKMTHFWGEKKECNYYPIWDKNERDKKAIAFLEPFFKGLTKISKPCHPGQYGYFKNGCECPIFGLHIFSNRNSEFIVNADEMWVIKSELYLNDKEWDSYIKTLAKKHLKLIEINT